MRKYKYLRIRTKNHTANPLRASIPSNGRPIVFRMGSTTPTEEIFPGEDINNVVEINTINACRNSSNKIKMKTLFSLHGVKTAEWDVLSLFATNLEISNGVLPKDMKFPFIIKHINSSKGNGIYYIANKEDLDAFVINNQNNLDKYIIENYHNFSKEYRLHVTSDGCFYTCRKMLKTDAEDRWHRHDSNSVWIMEENPLFDKPEFWNDIVANSVASLKAVGLDIGAVDVKCTSSKSEKQDFIILEINSAPSFGEITTQKYINELNKIINK